MRKHIVCFGDSNIHGYCADPNDCADETASPSAMAPQRCQKLSGNSFADSA